ncbi:ATP-dependent DNA helicase [Endomicrobium proavitum]|uniref:RecD-like exodeoxyribonuclease V alpha chain n=1 Tax=Endomicrobium proavitum TaxID=1408281 RepID=A0A0G3WKX7_9BACT|nr:AAA family ATPase [Endomicrobium proavitum]AKL98507.1 RecD-like exodeoxyribonuclease V alpha chain [Endomicrobium proavitum]
MNTELEITKEFKYAFDLISKTNDCVFVTGNAGTGKTTFLRYYISRAVKKTVVLAPTGVAALNAGGETIHSFFNFKPDVTLSKIKKKKLNDKSIYKKVETIIIDEASMLRCDLLDCIDKFLRANRDAHREPFGGVQMAFIGDLQQLPPVVTRDENHIFSGVYKSPYFLSAYSLNECMLHSVELKKVYRQQDETFIALLNSVRNGVAQESEIAVLNSKVNKNFKPSQMPVYLTTTNKRAAEINHKYLLEIAAPKNIFTAETENIDENSKALPAEHQLVLKKGAQIMMLNNDQKNRWVNGSIGIVEDISADINSDKPLIRVKFPNGRSENVEPYKWELFKYKWNDALKQIETESAGFFKQYPLKLSWAVTIHKSQGKTFENVIIDMERGAFAPGQLYVALSRATSFDGITLLRPITQRDIISAKINF